MNSPREDRDIRVAARIGTSCTRQAGKDKVYELVQAFKANEHEYKSKSFQEADARTRFIDPFFAALGWELDQAHVPKNLRDVHKEYNQKDNSSTKTPDYAFRVQEKTGARSIWRVKFFVEAKAPHVDLTSKAPVYQAKRYAFSSRGKAPIAILTDFQEFRVFNGQQRPVFENPLQGLIKNFDFKYYEYLDAWDTIWDVFSKEAAAEGSIDRLAGKALAKKTKSLDDEFLTDISEWRKILAQNIALRNKQQNLSVESINEAVQRILNRLIFIRNLEDRGIADEDILFEQSKTKDVYSGLLPLFRSLDDNFNGLLFKKGHLSEKLAIDDKVIKEIIKQLCYPLSPFKFDMIEPEILGRIYERFLGSKIRFTESHNVKVEEKPEVRKAGGVYYTPQYIVDYIVENTVGVKITGLAPKEIEKIKIVDPACGSGSFLLGAFQRLIDCHKDWYAKASTAEKKEYQADFFINEENEVQLTLAKKAAILKNNIFGVDIDREATEVAIMSLYLKMLDEGYDKGQAEFLRGHILPDMTGNIKCGNSLIDYDYNDGELNFEEDKTVKPFSWKQGFPQVFAQGGFDCVIGNPPYVDSEEMVKTNPELRKYAPLHYKTAKGNWDMYCICTERAISVLKNCGSFGFIIPGKFLSAPYGKYLKEYLSNFHIYNIEDYTSVRVFVSDKKINVYPIILLVNKTTEPGYGVYNKYVQIKEEIIKTASTNFQVGKQESEWNSKFSKGSSLIEKIQEKSSPLKENFVVENSATVSEAYKIKDIITESKNNESELKLINTGTIDRYCVLWGIEYTQYIKCKYHKPIVDLNKMKKILPNRVSTTQKDRIVFAGMVKNIEATIIDKNYYTAKSTTVIYPKDEQTSLKYALGMLNSNLVNYFFKETNKHNAMSGGFITTSKKQIEELIYYKIDLSDKAKCLHHDEIVKLVDQLLELNKKLQDATLPSDQRALFESRIAHNENRINALVYELYGLTEEEIALVEGK